MPENNPQTEDEQKKQTRKILKEAMGTDCEPIQDILMTQLQEALWRPEWRSPEKLQDFAVASIALLRDIKPKDTIEAMLAVQMVSTHHAALECSRRAMHQEQTFDGRSQNLKFAAALMNLYTRQMEALNKHRGKGQQKVTVEHVHVEAGAQAVVGSVHTNTPNALSPDPKATAPALEHKPGQVLDVPKPTERVKARRKDNPRGRNA